MVNVFNFFNFKTINQIIFFFTFLKFHLLWGFAIKKFFTNYESIPVKPNFYIHYLMNHMLAETNPCMPTDLFM